MDRIGSLTSNQIAKELQSYTKYNKYSQKEIKQKVGNVKNLRNELRSLEIPSYSQKVPSDSIKEILLQSDINTIKQYCKTSNESKLLCQDKLFWKKKYAMHNFYFPIVLEDDQTYMEIFDFMDSEIGKIKTILRINEIEKNRQYNKTKGIIVVRIEDMLADNLDDLFSTKFKRDKDNDMMFNDLVFTLKDKGYYLTLTNIKNEKVDIGYKTLPEVEKIFLYANMMTGIIDDDLGIIFNSMDDEAFDEDDISDNFGNIEGMIRACLRRGLWEGLNLNHVI